MSNNNRIDGLGPFGKTVLLTLGAIAGAALLALEISDMLDEEDESPRKPRRKTKLQVATKSTARKPSIESQMVQAGVQLLHRKQGENESLQDFLRGRYHGLFLYGRAGHQLNGKELDEVAKELGHFHTQCFKVMGHDADRALAEWYETSGQSRKIPLLKLMFNCPVIPEGNSMAGYIVYALTGELPSGHIATPSAQEWDSIKKELNLK